MRVRLRPGWATKYVITQLGKRHAVSLTSHRPHSRSHPFLQYMSFLTQSLVSQLRERLQISRTNSVMSGNNERTPLLNDARRTVENNAPSKGERIKAAQVLGAFEAGKLP